MEGNEASVTLKDQISALHENPGRPQALRDDTVRAVRALHGTLGVENTDVAADPGASRPPASNVFGDGPFLVSDIPDTALEHGVVVGIDEAGRGSVLGPMIYGAAFWNASQEDSIPNDFNDSKQLTEAQRDSLFAKILATPSMGFAIRVLHASEISRNMLRPQPYNLNQMSHDSAIGIIRHLLKAGVKIETCYIDTVGNAQSYQRLLESEFPGLEFVVESKADAKYAPCSAASVVAKVTRDRMIENWKYSEPYLEASRDFGSGYPSDPICKKWMADNLACKVFGFPDVVRFSWAPAKKALEMGAFAVAFEADEDDEEEASNSLKKQQEQMSIFLGKQPAKHKRKRYPYFERKKLQVVMEL